MPYVSHNLNIVKLTNAMPAQNCFSDTSTGFVVVRYIDDAVKTAMTQSSTGFQLPLRLSKLSWRTPAGLQLALWWSKLVCPSSTGLQQDW